jgi:hypothetical protein
MLPRLANEYPAARLPALEEAGLRDASVFRFG